MKKINRKNANFIMSVISFYLRPKAPFRLDLTVWALRRLPHNQVDRWDGKAYTRILIVDDATIKMDVTQLDEQRIRIDGNVERKSPAPELKQLLTYLIEKILGIRRDLQEFYTVTLHDKVVSPLVLTFMGVKPPCFPSVFESLLNAIACQQLSLHVGIELLNRLTKNYGRPWILDNEKRMHAFPLPEDLAMTTTSKLRSIGFSTNKAKSIIAVSRSITEGKTNLESVSKMGDQEALDYLTRLAGIGRWSAEYVLLRGLGRLHLFPGDDAGAQKNVQLLLRLKQKPGYEQIRRIVRRWQPYAGLVYFHFLLNKLNTQGYL